MDDWKRAARRRFLWPLGIAIVGIVVYAVAGSDRWKVIGAGILGLAATIAVALMFLEVALSEDRARERERR